MTVTITKTIRATVEMDEQELRLVCALLGSCNGDMGGPLWSRIGDALAEAGMPRSKLIERDGKTHYIDLHTRAVRLVNA